MTELRPLLADLLARLGLSVSADAQLRLLCFLEELLRWNRKVNLTAIVDPPEALEKHLVDSLTILPFLRGDERVLDVGSGGGFPGIPLKIARSQLRLVSVDAVGKKIAFQRHAGRLLQLTDFTPLSARLEDLPRQAPLRGAFDVIISRAFASLPEFARLALPFLAPGGCLLAMKGGEGERELEEASGKLLELQLRPEEVRLLQLPVSGAKRSLLLLRRRVP